MVKRRVVKVHRPKLISKLRALRMIPKPLRAHLPKAVKKSIVRAFVVAQKVKQVKQQRRAGRAGPRLRRRVPRPRPRARPVPRLRRRVPRSRPVAPKRVQGKGIWSSLMKNKKIRGVFGKPTLEMRSKSDGYDPLWSLKR